MAASEEPINRPTPREFFKSRTSDTFTKRFPSFAFLLVHMSLSQGTLPRSPLLPPAPPCTSTVPVSSRGTVIASPHPHPPAPPPAQFLAQKRCSVRICETAEETYPSGQPASLPSLKPQGWPGLCCSSLCRPPWQDRNGARVPPARRSPTAPRSLTCTPDADGCLCHREAHGAHSGHLPTATVVTGEVTAVLPTGGAMGF